MACSSCLMSEAGTSLMILSRTYVFPCVSIFFLTLYYLLTGVKILVPLFATHKILGLPFLHYCASVFIEKLLYSRNCFFCNGSLVSHTDQVYLCFSFSYPQDAAKTIPDIPCKGALLTFTYGIPPILQGPTGMYHL